MAFIAMACLAGARGGCHGTPKSNSGGQHVHIPYVATYSDALLDVRSTSVVPNRIEPTWGTLTAPGDGDFTYTYGHTKNEDSAAYHEKLYGTHFTEITEGNTKLETPSQQLPWVLPSKTRETHPPQAFKLHGIDLHKFDLPKVLADAPDPSVTPPPRQPGGVVAKQSRPLRPKTYTSTNFLNGRRKAFAPTPSTLAIREAIRAQLKRTAQESGEELIPAVSFDYARTISKKDPADYALWEAEILKNSKPKVLMDDLKERGGLLPWHEDPAGKAVLGITLSERLRPPEHLQYDPDDPAMAQRLTNFHGELLVKDPSHLKPARAAIDAAGSRDVLVMVQRSSNPAPALKKLRARPIALQVIHDFPRSKEMARTVHEQIITDTQMIEVRHALKELQSSIRADEKSRPINEVDLAEYEGQSLRDVVLRQLQGKSPGTHTMLIGHVSKGHLRFHDGSSLALSDIPRQEDVWIIGCRTVEHKMVDVTGLDFGTGRRINYADAASEMKALAKDFRQQATYRDMLLTLQYLPSAKKPPAVSLTTSKESSQDPAQGGTDGTGSQGRFSPRTSGPPSGFGFAFASVSVMFIEMYQEEEKKYFHPSKN